MRTYLGIDCGTQGTKALLVDEQGRPLGRGYAPHRLTELESGAREQQPAWWVEALTAAVRQALEEAGPGAPSPRALGVSGQQHGLVVLDSGYNVLRPAKLWNDTETAPQNAQLVRDLGGPAAWSTRFGVVPLTGYTISKLLWIQQNAPEDFVRIRHICLPHEYLNWWLTGRLVAEPGDASGTGYFDNRTRRWCQEPLNFIDQGTGQLFAALPTLVPSDSIVGTVLPKVAALLGLSPECLVAAGGGDNMMGAIGTGNVRPGVVTLSLGTSSTVYSFAQQPIDDPTGNVATFCSSTGGWLPLVCTMNCTNIVTATTTLLGKTVADIEDALAQTPPGADGLLMLPFLNGERTPNLPNARGTLSGLSATNYTPAHLIRAAVEGVSFGILEGLDRILGEAPATTIQVIGGGARSRAWRQLLADATGAQVLQPSEQESGCLGAAIQAAVAASALEGPALTFDQAVETMISPAPGDALVPVPALREPYRAARKRYAHLLAELHPSVR